MPPNASPTRSTFYAYSDVLIEKGDHLRLQDIQLSYQLNKTEIKWLPMNHMRAYVYANNLNMMFSFSKFNALFKQKYDRATGQPLDRYNKQLPNEPFFTMNISSEGSSALCSCVYMSG